MIVKKRKRKNILIHFQVANALEDLIKKYQRIPGNITCALFERIRKNEIRSESKEH